MRKSTSYLLCCLGSLALVACDDIIEEDISNDDIQIIAPTQGALIEGNTVQFSWQSLNGADDYRIQVFTSNQGYTLDSLVSSTNFLYALDPGAYQWRVKGENFAYETQYTFPISFTVEASENLSNQTVILQTPSDNIYTNDPAFILTWSSLNSADYYDLEIVKELNGQETVLQESNILTTSFTVPSEVLEVDAEYVWKVKAVNAGSETMFSERSFFIDRVMPNQPVLVSPTDQEITTSVVSFNWTNGTDTGNIQSTVTNSIEISSDINFTTLVHTSTTPINSYQYIFEDSGAFYWRVKVSDTAGNVSDYSNVRSINIQ